MRVISGCTLLIVVIAGSWAGEASAQQARKRTANRAASRVEAERPPARGFAVLAARFGTDERWFDITQLVRAKVSSGRLDDKPEQEVINPSNGELPDLIFGVHKAMVIAYAHNGRIGLWTRRHDRADSLPEAKTAGSESALTEPTQDDLDYLKPRAEEVKDLGDWFTSRRSPR